MNPIILTDLLLSFAAFLIVLNALIQSEKLVRLVKHRKEMTESEKAFESYVRLSVTLVVLQDAILVVMNIDYLFDKIDVPMAILTFTFNMITFLLAFFIFKTTKK